MADETKVTATPAQGDKKSATLVWIAFILLACAVILIWNLQRKKARELRLALSEAQQQVSDLREAADLRDRSVADLISKIEVSITGINGGLKTLTDTVAKQQEDLATLRTDLTAVQVKVKAGPVATPPGQAPGTAEPTGVSQPEVAAQLSALGDRIERLKNDVVLKETKILQTQITDAKGRLDKAEKEVNTLSQSMAQADLPGMKAKVQAVEHEVSQAEIEVKTLSKAHAEFKRQITGFFGDVFYNDPWGKYGSQDAAKGK